VRPGVPAPRRSIWSWTGGPVGGKSITCFTPARPASADGPGSRRPRRRFFASTETPAVPPGCRLRDVTELSGRIAASRARAARRLHLTSGSCSRTLEPSGMLRTRTPQGRDHRRQYACFATFGSRTWDRTLRAWSPCPVCGAGLSAGRGAQHAASRRGMRPDGLPSRGRAGGRAHRTLASDARKHQVAALIKSGCAALG
jgi:hypothetical protein